MAPATCTWSAGVDVFPMYRNNAIGDCALAAPGHMIQAWGAAGKKECVGPSEEEIVAAYSAVTGYDEKDPTTDQRADELDVLRYWQKTGIGGHKIGAYVAVEPTSTALVKDGVFLFGGLYIGLALPVSAQRQDVWEVPPGGATGAGRPGSWGGHAVNIVDFSPRDLTVVTWGAKKRMSWGFLKRYCEEAYAIISEDFFADGKAPNGFDLATLQADLLALRH